MSKARCIARLNAFLRRALLSYHASSGLTQEEIAARMRITPRACSALENGEYGFSAFSMMALFSILPAQERLHLFSQLCSLMTRMLKEAA